MKFNARAALRGSYARKNELARGETIERLKLVTAIQATDTTPTPLIFGGRRQASMTMTT